MNAHSENRRIGEKSLLPFRALIDVTVLFVGYGNACAGIWSANSSNFGENNLSIEFGKLIWFILFGNSVEFSS